jgi:branched-chain amino acid transport system permease protein
MDIHLLDVITTAGIFVLVAIGLHVVVGLAGVLSVGQAAFLGIGAYATAILTLRAGLAPFTALLAGCAVASILAALLSLTAIRVRDDYLLILTLGFGECFRLVFQNWETLTGGTRGIAGIGPFEIFGKQFPDGPGLLMVVWLAVIVVAAAVVCLERSPFGRALIAVRDDETLARSLGLTPFAYRASAMVCGALVTSVAGSVLAHKLSYIDSNTGFGFETSLLVFAMVVLGGRGSLPGAMSGATALVFLPEMLRRVGFPEATAAYLRQIIIGVVLIALSSYRPRGVFGTLRFEPR